MLHILNENFTQGLSYNILNTIFIISILCGILVIISKNPVVSVLFLISLFVSIATYLIILGINFIGLSYLLVYVGAVSILFLFILMLINIRISELVTNNSNSIPLAYAIGLVFFATSNDLLIYLDNNYNSIDNIFLSTINNSKLAEKSLDTNNNLSYVTSQIWDSILVDSGHISSIGNVIYTVYPIWLILTSIILLLAMVGTIIITIKQQ